MKALKEIEEKLRDGKFPNQDLSCLRHVTWQRIIREQRRRRGFILQKLPAWGWVLASIVFLVVSILIMLFLK